jgi:hypothetical protein
MMKARDTEDVWDREQIRKYESGEKLDSSPNMLNYYREKIKNREIRWTIYSHFWNITENRFGFDKDKILSEPEKWWIVNVDLHS